MNIGGGADPSVSGESRVIRCLPFPDALVVDVGANEGQYARQVLEIWPNARLYCIEPSPVAFTALSRNLQSAPVELCQTALGSMTGEADLFGEPGSALSSLYDRRLDHFGIHSGPSTRVSVTTLDNFCDQRGITHIDLLKLDVEGHELEVLKGAKRLLGRRSIQMIQFEFGGANIDSRTFFQDFWYMLSDSYRIFRVLPRGIREIDQYHEAVEQFRTMNYLCLLRHGSG